MIVRTSQVILGSIVSKSDDYSLMDCGGIRLYKPYNELFKQNQLFAGNCPANGHQNDIVQQKEVDLCRYPVNRRRFGLSTWICIDIDKIYKIDKIDKI